MSTITHFDKGILVLISIKTVLYVCYTFEYCTLLVPYCLYNILTLLYIIHTNTIYYSGITYNNIISRYDLEIY